MVLPWTASTCEIERSVAVSTHHVSVRPRPVKGAQRRPAVNRRCGGANCRQNNQNFDGLRL